MWQRLKELFRARPLERELDDEVAFHLQMLEEQFRAYGMSPADARAAARREFGGVAHAKEAYRDERGLPWLETTLRDIRYALRGLRHSPGFTTAAVLSLALGIGANTAIFSLFHALMLRLLPVAEPHELVDLHQTGGWIDGFTSYPLYREAAQRTDLFRGVLARTNAVKVRFREPAAARENFIVREFVSGNYFQLLGVPAALGRVFTPDDDRVPDGHPLAVLSYDCWRNRFGADQSVLGSRVLVDEKPLTIIGVAAPGFHGLQVETRAEVWVPLMMSGGNFRSAGNWWLRIVARARPEIPRQQLQAAVDLLMQQHLAAHYPTSVNPAFRRRVMQQRLEARDAGIGLSMLRHEFAKPLQILMAAVALVLLMACTNVANLLLARGAARQREIALCFSLGATRPRLVRQALTESLLLAAAGGLVGLTLGLWGTQVVVRFLPEAAGNPLEAALEPGALAFTLAVSAFSVLLFGLAPALRSTAVGPASGLRSQTAAAGAPGLRRALVVAQVAFSVVLVAMAGLFGRSLFALRSVDLGFHGPNVVAFNLDLPREMRGRDLRPEYRQLAEQLEALPGITSVSYGVPGPYQMGSSSDEVSVPGSERTANGPVNVATVRVVPRYFETLGAPLVMGREIDRDDIASARRVAVVNEAFVRTFLPGEIHPDRRWLRFGEKEFSEIVGVARDMRGNGIQVPAAPTVFLPLEEDKNAGWETILVRSGLPPGALLPALYREVSKLGPSIVIEDFTTLRQRIDDSIFEQRLLATLSGFFGALALVLAAVGLYGVVAYSTAGRTGEIGIRIALGARRGQVLWMILSGSLGLVSAGLAIGLFASLTAARAVGSILFGIQPSDPIAFASTALALALTGFGAALVPARRAASIDPMCALRHE